MSMKSRTALGLMTGTSMDGIDIALLKTNGKEIEAFGPTSYRPYMPDEKALIKKACRDAQNLSKHYERTQLLAQAELIITKAHRDAIETLLLDHPDWQPDIVGFHGQTILHDPDRYLTVQLGDGEALASMLNIDVVYNFRINDMKNMGQGAPLVPIYHEALWRKANIQVPTLMINLGGVANITYIAKNQPLIAFDTGPASALIDDLMMEEKGLPYDENGKRAAKGAISTQHLKALLNHPFFKAPPPKALDRNSFSKESLKALSLEDACATLTAFTAHSLGKALDFLPQPPQKVIVSGGGVHNKTMMKMIAQQMPCKIEKASDYGWLSNFIEAQAFAFLAVRYSQNLPITFPKTTGVLEPLTGGVLARP